VKLITALVRPSRVDTVKAALLLFGVRGFTVSTVYVPGFWDERVEVYRGQRWSAPLHPWLRFDVLAPDADTRDLVHVIASASTAPAHRIGAALWVTRVDLVVRVRTGEEGVAAL
jgi:nitrogen regulatory protein P-II 1